MTELQQLTAHKLTCLFETGSPILRTDNVSNESDERGYTCGWAGFTTADEEVVSCVEAYTRRIEDNHLASFLPTLRFLRDNGSADVSRLDRLGFSTHWQNACSNPLFADAYAEVVEKKFGWPAQAHYEWLGFRFPVSWGVLFDAGIQHGWESDPDGVPAMIERTGGRKLPTGALRYGDEYGWLDAFLQVRRATLENPANGDTRDEWRQSVSRVDVWLELLHVRNWGLQLPVTLQTSDYEGQVIE